MKCTSAIRQMAYGFVPDSLDEYLQMGSTTARWPWKNCLVAYRAQFCRGDHGPDPSILLEAITSNDLWIWHAFFGVSGMNNDVNVLRQSPFFNDLKAGKHRMFHSWLTMCLIKEDIILLTGYIRNDPIWVCVFVPRAVKHGACSLAWVVQFGTDRAVCHEPEQFSSELNNISLELYTVQRSIQRCVQVRYTLTKWYQEPGYDKQWQKTKKLHEPLAEAKPTGMKADDWARLDRQALGAVRLSLAKNVAYNVVNEKTIYSLLKALSNMYEKPSTSNKVFLIRQLVNMKMNEGASVVDHVNEFNSILSRLMSVDIKFDDEVQALLLLSSLPESWSGTVTAVSGSTGSTKLKFDNIRDLILGEDIRRKTSGEYSNSLLSAEDKGRGRKQDRGQKHNRSRSKSKKRGQSKNRQDITCWNCNQKGHFQNQCSKPVTSRDKEVNMAARDYDDALVCCVENTIDDRIMDSGASFHATYCKEELERFKLRSGKVRLADDKTLDIAGVGDVVLKTSFGTSWTLKDVRYIPGLKKRLISVGQLDEEGYHVGFGDQQWKVTKGSLVVARGNKRGSLYMVEVPSDGINATIDGRGNATLWHQRLGHMSEKGMKILASKGRIPDLQKAVVGFCEPCVLGKQKKVSFVKSGNTRKLQRLELVHTDVYGPTSVASIGGSRYYVTFIDDSSRKVWVYFLKNKSEVFNTFKKWKAAVENETNLRVKCLKSDNGGEYSSREFIEYCAENGIRMLKTVPKKPQQNEEGWQGKEVSLAHLRVFGCDSYVKVKDVATDKLDAKSVKCTFIVYGSDEMGYRFWDSKSHNVVQSRDVTFNEDSLYGAKAAIDSSNLTKPNQKDQVVLEDSPKNLANKSIVTKHGLSSEITQSPGESSDTSEGSENNGSFEDSGRSDEEYSEDGASSKDGGSETPQSYSKALSSKESVQWKKASIDNGGWCLTKESLARGVQFGTGRAVWHGSCSLTRVVQFGTDRAVWHEPEQFSSELNNISLV
ncbi:putative RNA-directed DNA polymerase [Tanacetum coccineum]|uniref:RNA-directed DNA polymerase n=1 Tax=Tanacetum coccineum TaxID=301880 RepID=A0ABQ4XIF8_9ASTR